MKSSTKMYVFSLEFNFVVSEIKNAQASVYFVC